VTDEEQRLAATGQVRMQSIGPGREHVVNRVISNSLGGRLDQSGDFGGCETIATWLDATSTIDAPMR